MTYHPRPGDLVRLSQEGLNDVSRCGVLNSYEKMERASQMRIIYVTDEPLTEPDPLWGVEVDNPDINHLLLHSAMFELIERPAAPWANMELPRALTLEEAIDLGVATVTEEPGGVRVITIG